MIPTMQKEIPKTTQKQNIIHPGLNELQAYHLLTGNDITDTLSETSATLDLNIADKPSMEQGYLIAKEFQRYCLKNQNATYYRSCFLDVDSSFLEGDTSKLTKSLQRLANTIYQKNR
ncbi:MAG: hypothetical protein ACP5N2_05795 [Candidatus Nanoarchaeia archaeon]